MLRKSSETSRRSEHSDSNTEAIDDGSGSSIGSDRQSSMSNYSERQMKGPKVAFASTKRSYSSSSCESSSDDENDSFQVDAKNFTTSGTSNHASKHGENYASSSESSSKSEVDNKPPVPTPAFQVYRVTHYQNGMSPTASPPIQVMDRSGGYDPSRIPSSIFERNGAPLEWSVVSNESLFSLNLGNHSSSRENAYAFGESEISEESSKSGELNLSSRIPSIIIEEISSARIEEIDSARESVNAESLKANETSDEASTKSEERLSEDQNEVKDLLQTASCKSSKSVMSSLSHRSATSAQSFAFPVKKRARPLCYCSNCSWAFCCCRWPICNRKCSNCGWAFRYCWNCSHSKCCGHASPILIEAERKSSVKADFPRQQSYEQEPEEVTRKSTCSWCSCCNWFHCFSCSSCCRWKLCCRWKPCCKCTTTRCKCCC